MKPIQFSSEAEREWKDAALFYESCSIGLGIEFEEALKSSAKRIAENPRLYPVFIQDARRCLFPRFPYSLIYIDQPHRIFIIAVAHTSRKPGYWRERLTDAAPE